MSYWSVAASLFCSISLFTSATEVATHAFAMAGAGNPAAVEQGLSGLVSRMGGEVAVPKAMAEAKGTLVSYSAKPQPAGALQRGQDWVLSKGKPFQIPADVAGMLGLTDGRSPYVAKEKAWRDDNDQTLHVFIVGIEEKPSIILTFKAADNSFTINWRTDINGNVISTVYSDATGTRAVPSGPYNERFYGQVSYWDAIIPASTAIASAATGA
jgi:hypothetical protein